MTLPSDSETGEIQPLITKITTRDNIEVSKKNASQTTRYNCASYIINYFTSGDTTFLRFLAGLCLAAVYMSVGAALMVYLEPDWFNWLQAFHFCAVTLTAVGYGDQVPHTSLGKGFVVVYILVWFGFLTTITAAYIATAVNEWHLHGHNTMSYMPHVKNIISQLFMIACLLMIGTIVFAELENESWGNSFYWTVVTLTTIGYGDYYEHTPDSMLFGLFFIFLGVIWFAAAIKGILRSFVDLHNLRHLHQVVKQGVTPEMLIKMNTNGNHVVDRYQFTTMALVAYGKCTAEDSQQMGALFDCLDKHNDGVLDLWELCHNGKVGRNKTWA